MLATGNKRLTEQVLSIRIFSDGFSFVTPHSQKDVSVERDQTLHELLETAFRNNALLSPDYDEVNIYADYPSTRIPLDEFRSEEAQALYRLTFGPDSLQGMNMHYEMLPALEVIEVFAIDKEIEELILHHYPHAAIHSHIGQTMNRIWGKEKRRRSTEQRLYASSNGRQLFLFNYKDGKLAYANSFEASHPSDQIYYLLYAWKQLGLDQHVDTCVLLNGLEGMGTSNSPRKDKELETLLHKYISHVTVGLPKT
ncbi:MAG: DUF3822 family protein [Bacteroidaceae bacterium]|nr:DUF3822 family protein [Bacteroidaceae bacterium]